MTCGCTARQRTESALIGGLDRATRAYVAATAAGHVDAGPPRTARPPGSCASAVGALGPVQVIIVYRRRRAHVDVHVSVRGRRERQGRGRGEVRRRGPGPRPTDVCGRRDKRCRR